MFRNRIIFIRKNYLDINIPLSKNLSFEFELELGGSKAYGSKSCESNCGSTDWRLFKFSIEQTVRVSHAGFKFRFVLWKLIDLLISIRDNRHWDFANNCWQTYEESDLDFDKP